MTFAAEEAGQILRRDARGHVLVSRERREALLAEDDRSPQRAGQERGVIAPESPRSRRAWSSNFCFPTVILSPLTFATANSRKSRNVSIELSSTEIRCVTRTSHFYRLLIAEPLSLTHRCSDVFLDAWRRLHDRRTDNASPRFRFLCDLRDSFEIILSRVFLPLSFRQPRLL